MKLIVAMRGKIGETEYFIATMKASEVVNTVRIPKEMPDWGNESVEERYQREINYKRVREQIAPYIANDKDRFFNALIVDVLNPETISFDPLESLVKLPSVYSSFGNSIGVLTLKGGEQLVPLDGQHRLAAIRFALYGKDEKGDDIPEIKHNPDIGNDDITLILVKHDKVKARKIFNKVNRYAKAVSKADNLLISEDDFVAILSRQISDKIFRGLVDIKSNTISEKSNNISTLSTVYEASLEYLNESVIYNSKVNTEVIPEEMTKNLWRVELEKLWKNLIKSIEVLNDAIEDPEESGRAKRIELRQEYIIMKPIVQFALIGAIKRLMIQGTSLDSALAKAANLDWSFTNSDWERVAVKPGKTIITGNQSRKFLSRFIAYKLGEKLNSTELQALEDQYKNLFDSSEKYELPERL
jgi:DNA sulfur modification protein DndB